MDQLFHETDPDPNQNKTNPQLCSQQWYFSKFAQKARVTIHRLAIIDTGTIISGSKHVNREQNFWGKNKREILP